VNLAGVHHVSLNVADVDEAGRFYLDVLGLTQIDRPDFGFPGMWLHAGDTQIHLIEEEGHQAPEGQHFAFHVADIEAVIGELRDAGVEVSDAMDIPGAGTQAFLKDPSGNLIELNQPNTPN
jgi:glyoxylase I family protein